jgi:hypothetical protein
VVDVGDQHRANASVAWARSDLGSLDIKANKAGIARAEPILGAAEDLSVFVDRRDWTGGADRRWGWSPDDESESRPARPDEPAAAPGANVASAVDFYRTAFGFPVRFTDEGRWHDVR